MGGCTRHSLVKIVTLFTIMIICGIIIIMKELIDDALGDIHQTAHNGVG